MELPHDNLTDTGSDKSAQERLLDAAEDLFCEHGFEGTSVRDLAAAAGCNLASVNYYFGGKDNLYIEVWRRQLLRLRQTRLDSIRKVMTDAGIPSLEQLLKAFAGAFVSPLVDEGKSHRLIKLMAREMLDQRLPANMFVDEVVKPTMAAMHDALARVCPGLDESKIPLVIFSIAGQLSHVVHIKAMFGQAGSAGMPVFDLAEAVHHIVKFSAAGIRSYVYEKNQ